MAKKADGEPSSIKVQREAEPPFKLPPAESLSPSLRLSLPPGEVERLRRQAEEIARLESRFPKPDPAKSARLAESRRLLDHDMAIRDGLVAPPWLEPLMKQLTGQAPPTIAPSPPEPKTDAPIIAGLTESRVDEEQRKDERRSRKRTRYAGVKSTRASVVLKRMFPDRVYPTRSEVPDADLWELFVEEWNRGEGKKLSLNHRPSQSTVLRMVGRKD